MGPEDFEWSGEYSDIEKTEWYCPTHDDWAECPGPCPDGTPHTESRTVVVKAKLMRPKDTTPPNTCFQCGMTEEDSFDSWGMPLTDALVIVAYGEEGYSHIQKYVCGGHLAWLQDEFRRMGFVSHHHGSTTLLEDQDCPGYATSGACPNPKSYGEEDPE